MDRNSSDTHRASAMMRIAPDASSIEASSAASNDARPACVILSGPAGTISLNAEPTIQAGMRRRFEWLSSGTVALID